MTLPRIHVGAPINRGALTIFPLWTEHAEAGAEYLTGPAAEAANALKVDELGEGTVPQLLATNHAPDPVLLLEGELLAGGLQTRVLNVTILLPAMQSLPIPVACVEAGRWGDRRQSRRGAMHSPPTLRRHKTAAVNASKRTGARHADQGEVWASVADYEQRLAAPSPTSSYADVADARKADIGSVTQDLRPLPGQRGFIVGVGGRVRGFELFDRAATFADYFDSLLAGYAMESLDAEATPTSASRARQFVRRLAAAEWSLTDAVGLGREIVIDDEQLTGSGLALHPDRPPVHLAAFA